MQRDLDAGDYLQPIEETAESGGTLAKRLDIAARIRALVDERPPNELAAKLHIGLDELDDAIDLSLPVHPVHVLAAISFMFGIDPTWLITGDYDAGTHRLSSISQQSAADVIRSILKRRSSSW